MANLKIIGAARVKALIAMLQTKRDEEIKAVQLAQTPFEEAQLAAMVEVGAGDEFREMQALIAQLNEVADTLAVKTGMRYKVTKSTESYQSPAYMKYNAVIAKIRNGEMDAKVAKIRADYATKENLLWLCETLEEAKAIVGVS